MQSIIFWKHIPPVTCDQELISLPLCIYCNSIDTFIKSNSACERCSGLTKLGFNDQEGFQRIEEVSKGQHSWYKTRWCHHSNKVEADSAAVTLSHCIVNLIFKKPHMRSSWNSTMYACIAANHWSEPLPVPIN